MHIGHLDKAKLLAALYNGSKPLGMGFLHYDPKNMGEEQAQRLLDSGDGYFDYLKGRVMKVNLAKDELATRGYNQDNGEGAAEAIIGQLTAGDCPIGITTVNIAEKGYSADVCRLPAMIQMALVMDRKDPCHGCNMLDCERH